MVFDPYDLAMDVTPESTKQVLDNREFAKALMLSFRLNEQDLILHVVESVPPQDSKYIDSFIASMYTGVQYWYRACVNFCIILLGFRCVFRCV
jgi:periodic tryptophan protein 2